MIDIPNWDAAVWINIATSLCVAICCGTLGVVAYVRRNHLHMVIDLLRGSITAWLILLIAFFLGRGIQVAIAGATIADPWFLSIGILLSLSSIQLTYVVINSPGGYELTYSDWKPGDPDRRTGVGRRASDEVAK